MKRLATLLWLLWLAGPCAAQSITLPAKAEAPKPGLVTITPSAVDADSVAWIAVDDGLQLIPSTLLKDDKVAVGVALQPGSYRVRAVAARCVMGKAALSPVAETLVVVGGTPPMPPVPPGPTPPVPPGPTPGPAPIPAAGFHVLVVYETADLGKMPPAQENVLYAKAVRDYLAAKCAPTPDGGKRGWYIVDQNVSMDGESKVWQDALKRPRAQVPWVVISNGTAGFEGPLPGSVDDTLKLLKQYGGP